MKPVIWDHGRMLLGERAHLYQTESMHHGPPPPHRRPPTSTVVSPTGSVGKPDLMSHRGPVLLRSAVHGQLQDASGAAARDDARGMPAVSEVLAADRKADRD